MTINSCVRPEHNLVILAHVGETTDDEFLAFYKSLFECDSFDLSMNLLVDLREADSSHRSSGALHRVAEFVREALGDVTTTPKVAVVAPRDISFGLARMYELFADSVPWDFVVFRSMETALAWLRVPEDLIVS